MCLSLNDCSWRLVAVLVAEYSHPQLVLSLNISVAGPLTDDCSTFFNVRLQYSNIQTNGQSKAKLSL